MRYIIAVFISILVLFSCNKDYRKFRVDDFSKLRVDTLQPYKWKDYSPIHGYVMYNITIKGYTNDTVKIKHEGGIDINLFGKIDTIIQNDYYGEYDIIVTFDPYKATRGKLEIEYKL